MDTNDGVHDKNNGQMIVMMAMMIIVMICMQF